MHFSELIVTETRLWEEGAQKTVTMRKKEGLADYRYFPEVPENMLKASVPLYLNFLKPNAGARYEAMGLSMQDVLFLANDVSVYCLSYWQRWNLPRNNKGKMTWFRQISDHVEIVKMVMKVFSESLKKLEQYQSGRTKLQGFFAGQVMKTSKGKATPALL